MKKFHKKIILIGLACVGVAVMHHFGNKKNKITSVNIEAANCFQGFNSMKKGMIEKLKKSIG